MGFVHYFKNSVDDLFGNICANKWRFVLCVIICLLGAACGIAFVCAFQYGWWYYNRCDFACKLMQGGFTIFVIFLIGTALLYVTLILCNMLKETCRLSCIPVFAACLYLGATTAALFTMSVMWGVLFIVFVVLEDLAINCFACFVCFNEKPICRRFTEAVCDLKQLALVLAVGLIYKIFAYFVIIKILTAII